MRLKFWKAINKSVETNDNPAHMLPALADVPERFCNACAYLSHMLQALADVPK
ncbi:MAG: hypothetical protein HYZ44_14910 [Bacteroidetes bacterium]|nr:hypothetical protein [Bacteroidota bacterium]